MKILADQNMPLVEEFFGGIGSVTRFDGRNLNPESLKGVDILLIRSVTKINKELLVFADKLKFIGSATIGIDHVDTELLKAKNITFSSAPGCNSIAVAEYVLSAIFAFSQETNTVLKGKTIGIVGVGNIGKTLERKLQGLGLNVLLCDPIRFESGTLNEHTELDSIIEHADIITFHVPLIKLGSHKTVHLLNKERLSKIKPNTLLINASRGEVIDNQALLEVCKANKHLEIVLDVWENEPNILVELLPYVRYASVHIAGHTLEGKARGTHMLYSAVCKQLKVPVSKQLTDYLPIPAVSKCKITDSFNEEDLGRLIHLVYDIRRDDGLLRANLSVQGFDFLRKNYPPRREFSTMSLESNSLFNKQLKSIGFNMKEKKEEI